MTAHLHNVANQPGTNMSANAQTQPRKTVEDLVRQAGGPDLVALLKSIRPQHGAVGSRDEDVSRRQRDIDATLELLDRPAQSGWTEVSEAMPETGEKLWLYTSYGEVIAGTKRWRQGWSPDYWETDAGELSSDDVTHWMPRRLPAPPIVSQPAEPSAEGRLSHGRQQ